MPRQLVVRRRRPINTRRRGRRIVRRRGGKSSTMLAARNPSNKLTHRIGPPSQEYVRLKYQTRIQFTLTADEFIFHTFALNGLDDPDLTGGGHKPRYFDQYKQSYGAYQVHGCAVRLQGNTTGAIRDNYKVGMIGLANSLVSIADYNDLAERGKRKIETTFSTQNPISRPLKAFFRPYLVQGVSKLEYAAQPRFEAGVGANPDIVPKLFVYVHTMDNTVGTVINVEVELTYYVRFFDRLLPSQST